MNRTKKELDSPLYRDTDGEPGGDADGLIEDVVRCGVHVAEHAVPSHGVVSHQHRHEEIQHVVEDLDGVRDGERTEDHVG